MRVRTDPQNVRTTDELWSFVGEVLASEREEAERTVGKLPAEATIALRNTVVRAVLGSILVEFQPAGDA